ncbi:DUF1365 domain-containing protein [Catenovulum sediminis]|uniref:DUF1365 domain-containing protein n=1 Tax=Catenovulum sediminis TaxID=1740262 RepID=A0ABV1RLA1_9ALTE|nr:DUF1365 domain-containing protein [Catenovulum sediminis]
MRSCIYRGQTFHSRLSPTQHKFTYPISMLAIDLDEVDLLTRKLVGFSNAGFSWGRFKRKDYCAGQLSLKYSVIDKAKQLGAKDKIDKVILLGQLRFLGLYFSPVNFYYLYSAGQLSSILAEVSNTPWNERAYYWVPKQSHFQCDKHFHVSPFNQIDSKYQWMFSDMDEELQLKIASYKQGRKFFEAGIQLVKEELNQKNYTRMLIRFPCMSVTMLTAIYWQALKLWLKGTPFYGYVEHKKTGE